MLGTDELGSVFMAVGFEPLCTMEMTYAVEAVVPVSLCGHGDALLHSGSTTNVSESPTRWELTAIVVGYIRKTFPALMKIGRVKFLHGL
jgi:hypothetical protein